MAGDTGAGAKLLVCERESGELDLLTEGEEQRICGD